MLSEEFLIERGYCCGHGCLMCPYEPKHTKGNTVMSKKNKKKKIYIKMKDFPIPPTRVEKDKRKKSRQQEKIDLKKNINKDNL